MREVRLPDAAPASAAATLLACLATILELSYEEMPQPAASEDPATVVTCGGVRGARMPRPAASEDPATGWTISRWLGGLGLGLARIADPGSFAWPGPWIAKVRTPTSVNARFVVMYGVPSGVVWDPAGGDAFEEQHIEDGFLIAAADIALALPPRPPAPTSSGTVEAICVAAAAGEPMRVLGALRAIAGPGLQGDRYVSAAGTFPSGPPGSALTMIAAEVCESFDPPLRPNEHRRNLVTRGIDLNRLVGRRFTIGEVRCRGMRLCEPCTVVQRYAGRRILRELVHRGGIRADVLQDGEIRLGDRVSAIG